MQLIKNINLTMSFGLILKPLSLLWEFLYRLRRSMYEYGIISKEYFRVPIISIGNISFGGTGKTPMIIWLNNYIEECDLTGMVLTRGYKGELENKSGIIKGGQRFKSNPNLFGDEPLLISKKMKRGAIVVGKDRAGNLKKYFDEIEPDVILLDDGFQHLKLFRSLNILLFDALLPLEKYKTAPLGYLREGLSALKDADAVVISRADQVSEDKIIALQELILPYCPQTTSVSKVKYTPSGVFNCFDDKIYSMKDLAGKKVIALTAIASPESFYRLIEEYEGQIAKKIAFTDHYIFTQEDINDALVNAIKYNAIILVSEKDMVKIRRIVQDDRVLYINISLSFISGEQALVQKIQNVLSLD